MAEQSEDMSLLNRIRNMWQFANLCQWIYIFGKIAKIDESLEAEDIETECLKPSSDILNDIALSLLKLVSPHRGLTRDIFDDQLRKQYLEKLPDNNPFGEEGSGHSFSNLDVCTKITVLQTLTEWTMIHPERIREKMEEQKDVDQASWRIEPYGWDSDDRTYYVLDDNRVYRLTEPPPPPAPVTKSKKRKSQSTSRRSGKRHHSSQGSTDHNKDAPEENNEIENNAHNGLGGATWECVAVTLDEVKELLHVLRKSRDNNQKTLWRQLEEHLLPILEKQEDSRKRKELQRERELLNLAKMATAKRSSRIANKAELKKEEERGREEEERAREEESRRLKDELRERKLQKERDARLFAREKRLKERESRRHAHEEELSILTGDGQKVADAAMRMSERRLNAEIEKNKQALENLAEEDQDWVFDCVCGLYGQIDDGTHSVACERCNVWQHSKCIGVKEDEAERTDFHFICSSCRKRLEEAQTPRKTIKIKIKSHSTNVSPSDPAKPQPSLGDQQPIMKPIVVTTNGTSTSPGLQNPKQNLNSSSEPSGPHISDNSHATLIESGVPSFTSGSARTETDVTQSSHPALPRASFIQPHLPSTTVTHEITSESLSTNLDKAHYGGVQRQVEPQSSHQRSSQPDDHQQTTTTSSDRVLDSSVSYRNNIRDANGVPHHSVPSMLTLSSVDPNQGEVAASLHVSTPAATSSPLPGSIPSTNSHSKLDSSEANVQ